MKKKKIPDQNYLEKIPARHPDIGWNTDQKGIVTLEIENKGWANRLAQKLFKRPKISFVHLDEMGSFIWPLLDGKQTIGQLGEPVENHFGEKSHPLYPRLVKYFQILESYHFIVWNK
jgi:hypothetical protein